MFIVSVFGSEQIKTGGHKRLVYLLRGLADRGHDVVLLSKSNLSYELGGVEQVKIGSWGFSSSKIDSVLSLASGLLNQQIDRPDLLIAFGLGSAVPGTYIKYRTGAPLLLGLRSDPIKNVVRQSTLKEKIHKAKNCVYLAPVLNATDRYVVQLEHHKSTLSKRHSVDPQRIDVIPNNILDDLEEPKQTSKGAQDLLFVGSLIARKGVDDLLKAFDCLHDENSELHLHIAGKGPLEKWVESYVSENGMRDQVTLHGYVDRPRSLMRRSDLVIIPSRVESFPNVALEAMSVGTPFIVSDLPEMRSAFGQATEYFDPSDPDSLADKIRSLERKENYAELQQRIVKERGDFVFDWIGRFEQSIEGLIRKN